ncbi:MAG: DTW domain-containing protein [Thiopseudomonas sp.]|nr:DTW domain-containing protein [Thiopseudomonas sp.]MCK9464928.1 DTW domain-containing protein [Thiopseudomonas sp.]
MPHAVARLRAKRLAISKKPFQARGALLVRCPRCRVAQEYCICAWQPQVAARSAVCLLMYDAEPLKPSNTGWLIADVVADTFAFGWARTEVEPALLDLLADPQWQPYVVFPQEYAQPNQHVVHELQQDTMQTHGQDAAPKRPLFIVLDGTWHEARKMFRKSEYLHHFPILSLRPEQVSRYHLRHSVNLEHLSTAEVMVLCLHLAEEVQAAEALAEWFVRFNRHYLAARTPLSKQQAQRLMGETLPDNNTLT